MENAEILKLFAYCGALPTILIVGLSKILPMITGARSDLAETGARVGMLDQLQARLDKLEKQQNDTQAALDVERTARRDAEDKVAKLSRRVASLEGQLIAANIQPV